MRILLNLLVMSLAVSANAKLIIKPGLYNIKTKVIQDGKEINVQAEVEEGLKQAQESLKAMNLDKMPPQMRAQMEEAMKNMGVPTNMAEISPSEMCYHAKDLSMDKKDLDRWLKKQNAKEASDCKSEYLKVNSKEIVTKSVCKREVIISSFKALSPTQFVQETKELSKKGKEISVATTEGKFVSSKCPDHILKREKEMDDLLKKTTGVGLTPNGAPGPKGKK